MEIPDCSYSDLWDSDNDDDSPELQKIGKVWEKMIDQYHRGVVNYHKANPVPKWIQELKALIDLKDDVYDEIYHTYSP